METSQDRLKELLAARRTQIPGDDYFGSVLPEFHRRLRAQSIKQNSLMEIVWERFQQTFSIDLSHSWRYAGATCVAAVIAIGTTIGTYGLVLHPSTVNSASQPRLLTLDNTSLQKPGVEYSLAEASDLNSTTKVDQQLDRVSFSDDKVSPANFMVAETPAHYVLTNHPVTYDTQVAF